MATTAHEVQVRETGEIPLSPHDVRLDVIVAPSRVLRCDHGGQPADGIRCGQLSEEKIASIPLLQRLHPDA